MLNITVVLTSVTNLVEINHEGGEGQRNGLPGLDAGEDLVHHADPGPLCRNKAANVCQEHYQTNLYWAGVLQCSRKFFTGQEHTTLSPLFVLHNSFSSPAQFSFGPILLVHYHHYDVAFWYHALYVSNCWSTWWQLLHIYCKTVKLKRHRVSISQVLHFVLIIVWPCEKRSQSITCAHKNFKGSPWWVPDKKLIWNK